MLREFFILIFLAVGISSIAQNKTFETSVIIDYVKVKNSTDTYALYLPKEYDPNHLSSIVFIFEPMARGQIGIQPFIEAAEKYNYILICSNNSRNGLFDDNFTIINRLFTSVFETFNIDENGIYTAGFSGGSRLATAVAVLTKQIQGVIACGAGFSPNNSHIPMSKENFSYVGLVGDRDMNYQEMLKVKDWLNKFQIDNEIFTYEDDHRWPPSEQLLRAFDWLEVQAYKKKIKRKNELVLKEVFDTNYKIAKELERTQQIELSVWEYERIKRIFSRYYKLDSINNTIKQLKGTTAYSEETKIRLLVKEEEAKIRKTFVERFSKEIAAQKTPANFKWWTKELEKFNEDYLKSNKSQYQKMGKRVGYAIYAMAIETATTQLREKKVEKAIYCHELATMIVSDRPFPYYLLAIDYALMNNEDKVIVNIELALLKGFPNKEYILNTKEFYKYKNSERFNLLFDIEED